MAPVPSNRDYHRLRGSAADSGWARAIEGGVLTESHRALGGAGGGVEEEPFEALAEAVEGVGTIHHAAFYQAWFHKLLEWAHWDTLSRG